MQKTVALLAPQHAPIKLLKKAIRLPKLHKQQKKERAQQPQLDLQQPQRLASKAEDILYTDEFAINRKAVSARNVWLPTHLEKRVGKQLKEEKEMNQHREKMQELQSKVEQFQSDSTTAPSGLFLPGSSVLPEVAPVKTEIPKGTGVAVKAAMKKIISLEDPKAIEKSLHPNYVSEYRLLVEQMRKQYAQELQAKINPSVEKSMKTNSTTTAVDDDDTATATTTDSNETALTMTKSSYKPREGEKKATPRQIDAAQRCLYKNLSKRIKYENHIATQSAFAKKRLAKLTSLLHASADFVTPETLEQAIDTALKCPSPSPSIPHQWFEMSAKKKQAQEREIRIFDLLNDTVQGKDGLEVFQREREAALRKLNMKNGGGADGLGGDINHNKAIKGDSNKEFEINGENDLALEEGIVGYIEEGSKLQQ